MRILHTADWHLGHTLNGWQRDAEHRLWLSGLADILEDERIDVLLIAGDIYDGINPSGESQRILYDALAEFRRRRPALITIMTSGNHDPSGRLDAPESVLRACGARVAGTLGRVDGEIDTEKHLIPLPGADGKTAAWVLAIPFLRASDLPGLTFAREDDHISPIVLAAHRFHHDLIADIADMTDGLPIIAMGHLHCNGGSETEDSERRILLGGEHALPHTVFPPEIGYVALGHLHLAQNIDGGRVRYSGSCFPMSSTEAGYQHGVTIVDLNGREFTSRHLVTERPSDFIRIPANGRCEIGDLETSLAGLDLDPSLPVDLRPFIHLNLAANGPASVIRTEAERIISGWPVRLAGIKVIREGVEDGDDEPVASLSEISVTDLFSRAFEKVNGTPPEPRHIAAFNEIAGSI